MRARFPLGRARHAPLPPLTPHSPPTHPPRTPHAPPTHPPTPCRPCLSVSCSTMATLSSPPTTWLPLPPSPSPRVRATPPCTRAHMLHVWACVWGGGGEREGACWGVAQPPTHPPTAPIRLPALPPPALTHPLHPLRRPTHPPTAPTRPPRRVPCQERAQDLCLLRDAKVWARHLLLERQPQRLL